ncbi:ArsR/SmtB family transcription factor [Micrococcoides hystricis]|uniref:ArsR/SmtB family transcription factor n=1 Tax=Micrococcoides hystricis TaxID=1572761 RepID=A0ABV6PCD7_9MICC
MCGTSALNLSQSTISHHLKLLVDAGLLLREQRGTWGFYRLSEAVAEKTDHYLRAVFNMQEA